MLFALLVSSISATSVEHCDADDGVCLLQFMKREGVLKKDHSRYVKRNDGDTISQMTGGFDFESLVKHQQEEHEHTECPGEFIYEYADPGLCSREGSELLVSATGNINIDISKYFGDNVVMKYFKYYVEECVNGVCELNELIAPGVSDHKFPVGVSHVKVEGYDIADNQNECFRTVYVYDSQPPAFPDPDSDVDGTITVELSPDACDVSAGTVFGEYEAGGWSNAATDNCDKTVEVVKKIYDENGNKVWDSSVDLVTDSLPLGPGTYHFEYVAMDDHMATTSLPTPPSGVNWITTTHTVTLNLVDLTEPYNMTGCPTERIEYIIEAHEAETEATWSPPYVTGDNCGNEDQAYVLEQTGKFPGMTLPVGSHEVRYSLFDMYDNVMPEECIFEIHIIQKAHPVTVQCPDDVTFQTVEDAHAGIVTWMEPLATQGGNTLPSSKISYTQGVFSGMMFPFGVTTITVNATGEITGDRVDEHLMFDECSFVVEVTDPFNPKVDGRMYRCEEMVAGEVAPYKICDGPEVEAHPEDTYMDNFGYITTGVFSKASLPCCTSERGDDHICMPVPGSSHNKYCVIPH
jgi:hypothetical protein